MWPCPGSSGGDAPVAAAIAVGSTEREPRCRFDDRAGGYL